MLRTTIQWSTNDGVKSAIYLDIVNITAGRISDYALKLYHDEHGISKDGFLRQYPRWSEPALGLVARALCQTCFDSNASLEMDEGIAGIVELRLVTELIAGGRCHPREVESIRINARGNTGVLHHYPEESTPTSVPFIMTDGDHGPFRLAVRAICRALYWSDKVPPFPDVFNPPVHTYEGVKYVRLSDIPEPARGVFERRLDGSTVPGIPHEARANVAYVWDWDSFAGN